ncbi:uncharacterized protein B0H18DRAFT_890546 [Fomitopsis serialis]|uniref:uncharacterized protein n=1 Tax=Fomitopsis serialis TaxID=139415 RepID=UPI002007D937|nr:uncharacterized protein B0H18DRAFT_890546 [Neoantrodia serialis]KAH9912207.1 hypothetical protein B0H18DRAFT_890546 [Neoantrodia serialis]
MEENIWLALHDIPTLTELAVLAIYGEVVCIPYIRSARACQNGLRLGPLHDRVKAHSASLIDNPNLVLATDATYETAVLDGSEWERSEVIEAIHRMIPELPALPAILVAFLKGAAETWERFTEEFAPGSEISTATSDELDQAWMLSTNDANEGALGAYRLWTRQNPRRTQAYFNAQKRYHENRTQDFMDAMLDEGDHTHIRQKARELDSSGHEVRRREQQAEHDIAVARQRAAETAAKEQRARGRVTRLREIELIDDEVRLEKLTRDEIDNQLKVRRLDDPDILSISSMKKNHVKKAEALAELRKAIARAMAREAAVQPGSQSQTVGPSTHQDDTVQLDQTYTLVVDNDLDSDTEE